MLGVVARPSFRVSAPIRQNAKTWGRKFEARVLEPGIVSYEDAGCGKAFLTKASIEASMDSFVGRPLILTPRLKHKKIAPKDLERDARGYISGWYYGSDGWFWVTGICHDDEAKKAIESVGFCSCAYEVEAVGAGGEYHAIPYDEEITKFSGEHLAIVDRPRYEGATIRLNSKTKTIMNPIKWIKKLASRENAGGSTPEQIAAAAAATAKKIADEAAAASRENSVAEEVSGETELEIPTADGKGTQRVPLATLIERFNAKAADPAGGELGLDDTLVVAGKELPLRDLVAGYVENEKRVANADKDDDDEEKKKKEKENAAAKAAAASRENATDGKKFVRVVLNARANGSISEGPRVGPDDLSSRVNRGAERYGSAKPNTAGKN